ncbi:MAG: hypothetical protein AAFR70_15435, partial [Pseudomonadota bacterium]
MSGQFDVPYSIVDPTTGATTTGVVSLTVGAVADPTVLPGGAVTAEDTPLVLPITVGLTDTDGSETITAVTISGIPSGAAITWPPGLPAVLVTNPDGSISVTGSQADIQSALAQLTLTPPADFSGEIPLVIEVTSGETNSDPNVPGHGDSTTIRHPFPVTVTPVPDLPVVSGTSTVDEDMSVNFGADITIPALDATDGSETITDIVLGNIPADATVMFTAVGGVTVTPETVNGVTSYTITGGTEADIRQTLASFTLTPPLHGDAEIPVSIAITKNDAGVIATTTGSHDIIVSAVADAPTVSGVASGFEDQPIALPVTANLVDD